MIFFLVGVCFVAVMLLVALVEQRENEVGGTVISRHDELFGLPLGALPGPEGAPRASRQQPTWTPRSPSASNPRRGYCPNRWGAHHWAH
ncbi:MAG: hypothetical protein L0G49_03330, partial [Luteococcus sp.]|uniref:hypothetical protein n=1 Tax=Luteococcus sp. TaxID=1969402 RepID=UPI002649EB7E